MIYLDNSATSFPKPRGMMSAMEECIMNYCGNPGRSGHKMSLKTGEEVYKARRSIAELFNINDPGRLVFTKNTTEALNMGIKGVLVRGDHVITTSMEHNSVLRPLKALEKKGVSHTIVKASAKGFVRVEDIKREIRPSTRMIVVTAASNVTGTIMPVEEIGRLAADRKILFMVDGAQAAGVENIDVEKMNIDMLAVPGHKGLLGPLGTGMLYAGRNVRLAHIMEGGTGTDSKSRIQPCEFPEGYEAGTINAPAIIGLAYSADFVKKIGTDVIAAHERELIQKLDCNLEEMDFVIRYGPDAAEKTGISLFNIKEMGCEEVTFLLDRDYDIAVRGGMHCAGLAHRTIGTWNTGAVRISVGPFSTMRDVMKLTDAVWKIGRKYHNVFTFL